MSAFIVLMALTAAICTGVSQLCFKHYMADQGRLHPLALLRSKAVVAGILLYGGFFVTLTAAYWAGGNLSIVFPLTALAYLLVPALGWLLLGERFGWRVPFGAVVIVIGCVLLIV